MGEGGGKGPNGQAIKIILSFGKTTIEEEKVLDLEQKISSYLNILSKLR